MKNKLRNFFSNLRDKNRKKLLEEAKAIKKLTPKKQTDFSDGSPGGGGVNPL